MHDLFVYAGFGAGTPQQDYGDKFGTMVESCSLVAGFGAQKPQKYDKLEFMKEKIVSLMYTNKSYPHQAKQSLS